MHAVGTMTRTERKGGAIRAAIRGRAAFATLLVALLLLGCEPWPRDPESTLESASDGTIRVGATEAPPYLVRAGEVGAGPEAELVIAFARSIDARVEWRWGALDDHLHALERHELDLVAGGLTAKSPWKKHVGLTRAWRVEGETKRVLAVPPGENRTLVALERLIERRRTEAP